MSGRGHEGVFSQVYITNGIVFTISGTKKKGTNKTKSKNNMRTKNKRKKFRR